MTWLPTAQVVGGGEGAGINGGRARAGRAETRLRAGDGDRGGQHGRSQPASPHANHRTSDATVFRHCAGFSCAVAA